MVELVDTRVLRTLSPGYVGSSPTERTICIISIKPDNNTLEYIKDNMIYVPKTGKVFRRLKDRYKEVYGISKMGYLRANVFGKSYQLHNVVWFLYYGEWPTESIDHDDRNKQNNKIENLKYASFYEQMINRSCVSKCGLYIYNYSSRYRVIIDKKHLKAFKDLNEAIKFRNEYLDEK